MAEERILIARSTDYTISDTKDGALFEGKIAPHNANVFSKQEAIERIAKVFVNLYIEIDGTGVTYTDKEVAEEVLNALLEGK